MNMEAPLLKNIMALGDSRTWENSLKVIEQSVSGLMDTGFSERIRGIKRVYFIGCGTSLYAGQVGKSAMEYFAGIPSEAVPAHTFSYYYGHPVLDKDTLVVGISATGTSETVCKALRLAKAAGSLSMAITSNLESAIGKASDLVVLSGNFDDRTVVKSKSYIYTLLTMYALALHIGRIKNLCDDSSFKQRKDEFHTAGLKAEEFYKNQMELIDRLANQFYNVTKIFIIGAGPNLGTMEEAALKVVEMSWVYAECQELEDFMHGRFRVADRTNPFFILAPHGKSDERILDFLSVTHHIGSPTVVLTDRATPELVKLATQLIVMPSGLDEATSPLLYILPFYLLGYKMGILKGHDPASRRYEDIVPQETFYKDYKQKLEVRV